ncbi:MAG: ribose 5-phosphate isomerase B [Candidatus Omnitrophica bacterium]|nr:ribose 5-phosphate isomerase B [Candidatus Omnitrophota bacterium]MBU4303277.1 ribose 5-phosphate isomerase B [Candidatus Omnitrophota bacterium]MBU4418354.1 ribose 5-phosphate isomerase B [Candidatus Omnitrophota bacterium]MBU4468306.1 ribose 5-phosphate isomerase B [Candidatus Omnitrophota bacterium]MCG2707925.1 ribose 5-phosphate isomerase B [Candidatus Omnitrophota bacterium]
MTRLLIGSDHAGFVLKEKLKAYLEKKAIHVKDLGTYSKQRCDYPVYAYEVAKNISSGKFKRGILICKSGVGNSIVANRLPGVRAALCDNLKITKLSREHNDSNILVLGSGFVKADLAKRMVWAWLNTKFLGGRHLRRIKLINQIDKKINTPR